MFKKSRKILSEKSIPSLCAKVEIILEVIGQDDLVKKLQDARKEISSNSQKKDSEWRKETIIKTIESYTHGGSMALHLVPFWAKALNITEDTFLKPLPEFVRLFPGMSSRKLRGYAKEETLPSFHKKFAGYHLGWFQWPNTKNKDKPIYKILLKFENILPIVNMIDVKMTTLRHFQRYSSGDCNDPWGFTGRMLPIASSYSAHLSLEHEHLGQREASLVSIWLSNGDPVKGIWGIYTAEPRITDQSIGFPTATRFFLKKTQEDCEENLFKEIGWISIDDAKSETGVDSFSNSLDQYGVLVTISDSL